MFFSKPKKKAKKPPVKKKKVARPLERPPHQSPKQKKPIKYKPEPPTSIEETVEEKTENQKRTQTYKPIESRQLRQDFIKKFKSLCNCHHTWEVWSDFITMVACAISNSMDDRHYETRESMYMERVKRYTDSELAVFPELMSLMVLSLEYNPEQDFLGEVYMSLELSIKQHGQFFTPYDLCKAMAMMTMTDVVSTVEKERFITINDPACGAGATLIASINEAKRQLKEVGKNHQLYILASGQDIDTITGLMCYIQLSLLGVAGYVKIGNTITDPICEGDNLDNYWFTPMYFWDVWSWRRLFSKKWLHVEGNRLGDEPRESLKGVMKHD